MKIECTPAELFELTGRVEIKSMMDIIGALTRGLEELRGDLNASAQRIFALDSRADHHDALLDIHEMRTGGQPIFNQPGAPMPDSLRARYQNGVGEASER